MNTLQFVLFILIFLFILPFIIELIISLTIRRWKRRQIYQLAKDRSIESNRKLLVVGDPDTGCINYYLGRDYQCGDICLDLTGCPGCPNSVKEDLLTYLKTQEKDSLIIFVSCTLEYLSDLASTIKELERVSGSSDNLFIVSVESYSPLHFLFEGSRNIILTAPPTDSSITWSKLPKMYEYLHKLYGKFTKYNMAGFYLS